jgi:hypothetical protein
MALVHYVRSLGTFARKVGNEQAMASLSKQLASEGETIPNRIPVSLAIAKLSQEYKAPRSLGVDESDRSSGAMILRRVLTDPDRAARFLVQSQAWQSNAGKLAAALVKSAPGNGFSVETAALNASEWQALYMELLARLKSQR